MYNTQVRGLEGEIVLDVVAIHDRLPEASRGQFIADVSQCGSLADRLLEEYPNGISYEDFTYECSGSKLSEISFDQGEIILKQWYVFRRFMYIWSKIDVTIEIEDIAVKPCYLYRHFNANNTLLYVGVTHNPSGRFSQHLKNSSWINGVIDGGSTTYQKFDSAESARLAEKEAIKSERPRFNVQHNV